MKRSEPLPIFPERIRKGPGKKDTRRWCRGVVGREHCWETIPWRQLESMKLHNPRIQNPYVIDRCKACGQERNLRRAKT